MATTRSPSPANTTRSRASTTLLLSTSQPTRWSTIRGAGAQPPSVRRAALERLCAQYWFPLFAHQRRRGRSTANAATTVQALLTRLIRGSSEGFAAIEQGPNRFREWLLIYLQAHERDLWGGGQASAPRPDRDPVPVHGDEGERRLKTLLTTHPDPLVVYEYAWASETLRMTRDLLAQEMSKLGQARACELLLPMLDADSRQDRAAVGAELGQSDVTLRVTLFRLRAHFRELLLAVVGESLVDRAEAGHELSILAEHLVPAAAEHDRRAARSGETRR